MNMFAINDDKTELLNIDPKKGNKQPNLEITGVGAKNQGKIELASDEAQAFGSTLLRNKKGTNAWAKLPSTLGLGKLNLKINTFGGNFKFFRPNKAPKKAARTLDLTIKSIKILSIVVVSLVALVYGLFSLDMLPVDPKNPPDDFLGYISNLPIDKYIPDLSFLGISANNNGIDDLLSKIPGHKKKSKNTKKSELVAQPSKKEIPKKSLTSLPKPDKLMRPGSTPLPKGTVFPNPYWYLPNSFEGEKPSLDRALSSEEVQTFRENLSHPLFYQRYKLIDALVSSHFDSAYIILLEALNQPRLWLRMRAAEGLSKLGYNLSLTEVEQALGHDPTYRVANYFKRFGARGDRYEHFLLRHALKVTGDKARLAIVQGLMRDQKSELNQLYLVAAMSDPGNKVQAYINRNKPLKFLGKEQLENIKKEVQQYAINQKSEITSNKNGNTSNEDTSNVLEEEVEMIDDEPLVN